MVSNLSIPALEEPSGRAKIAMGAGFATALVLYIAGVGVEPTATLTGIEYQPLNYAFMSTIVAVGTAKMLTPSPSSESTAN